MSGNRKDDREALDRLAAAMIDDILAASEEELIAELLDEGGSPTQAAGEVRALIDAAAQQCGQSRLAAAKAALASERKAGVPQFARLNPAEARRRLASVVANDASGLSLAARNESNLSDDDVFGMLADLEELGVLPKADAADGGE